MNYVYPPRSAFIIPHGTQLKKKSESGKLRNERLEIRNCLNKKKSKNGKKVYDIEIVDD